MFLDDDRRRTLFHGHSFTANPIACAAARASLALIDADCDQRRQAIEAAHRAGLARIAGHPAVTKPRVLGTVAAFDLATQGSYLDPIGTRLAAKALAAGILLRPLGNVGYLLPPYCATPAELAAVYDLLVRFLEDEI
jgi:adenosylmethionine-8-amino-7-oxononanoate aminotransferase